MSFVLFLQTCFKNSCLWSAIHAIHLASILPGTKKITQVVFKSLLTNSTPVVVSENGFPIEKRPFDQKGDIWPLCRVWSWYTWGIKVLKEATWNTIQRRPNKIYLHVLKNPPLCKVWKLCKMRNSSSAKYQIYWVWGFCENMKFLWKQILNAILEKKGFSIDETKLNLSSLPIFCIIFVF